MGQICENVEEMVYRDGSDWSEYGELKIVSYLAVSTCCRLSACLVRL